MWGKRILGGLCSGAALALTSVWAADLPVTSAVYSVGGGPQEAVLAAYRDLSSSRSRNYDRTQDISPRQMVILLEVAERTGASLGQALATGEHESARTWNDHVRPTLKSGNLGSAAGVWQFVPATFHAIVKKYGARLLALSAADAAAGRGALDLGEGPFSDAEVRGLIQETVDGQRGVDDEKLQLLRHNFAVLAFAKHYLSLDTGATTPEEDYLFHFLGAGEGRRVLELARGEARNTLSVKPVETPLEPLGPPGSELAAADPRMAIRKATSLVPALPPAAVDPAVDPVVGPPVMRLRIRGEAESSAAGGKISTIQSQAGLPPMRPLDLGSTTIPPFSFAPPPVSAEWGLPADSPTVTGNLGMFYRDGKGQTQPYTWGEFMEHLARRVRADQQPAMVRAKYGVGFSLNGGDLPHRAFNPEKLTKAADFRHRHGRSLPVPEALVTGPLNQDEAEHYKQRLGALVNQGDDEPTESLPPEALSALQHLGLLPERVQELSTTHPEVRDALHEFRKRVGKDQPDDPAHSNRLMPAERIALEIYDRRLAHYAGLQACQEASSADAPDLKRISKLPIGLQRPTAPHVALVQKALAAQGLLKQPTKKQVWRDKKRKKHVVYKTLHFAGKVDKATIAALNTFQLRNGLRRTDGVLDAVTLELLGLPAMGPEIFLPLSGPQCAIHIGTETAHLCDVRASIRPNDLGVLSPTRPSLAPRWWSVMRGGDCSGPPVESS
jgi:hypothetical protein